MPTSRERLVERASQWYPGKDKNIWSGPQDKRFQSLTDPRRLSAEKAMRGLNAADEKGIESGQKYQMDVGLEKLRQQGAMGLEGMRQQGAMGLQKESAKSDFLTQQLNNLGAMARQRLSTAPSMLQAQARWGKGGLESQEMGLKRDVYEKEYGKFPDEGLRNRQFTQAQKMATSKAQSEAEKTRQDNLYKEYGLYLKEYGDPIGGIAEGAPSFGEWQAKLKKKPNNASNYIGDIISRYGASE